VVRRSSRGMDSWSTEVPCPSFRASEPIARRHGDSAFPCSQEPGEYDDILALIGTVPKSSMSVNMVEYSGMTCQACMENTPMRMTSCAGQVQGEFCGYWDEALGA